MRNLVEDKHIKLSRSAKLGADLKPNAHVRDELNKMINYPHTKVLTAEEQEMLYKYRFNLMILTNFNFISLEYKCSIDFIICILNSKIFFYVTIFSFGVRQIQF